MKQTKIPVTILTGFLGSGKTTLLNHILKGNHGKKIAVIENEFGEIGIDNELVIGADEEIFEMNNGCICCTVRGDLIRILSRLVQRKDKLDMILIETTGLANPAPVAQTFWVDPELKEQFSLDAIITLVDAKHIGLHLNENMECKEQIAFADIIILNKIDLVSKSDLEKIENSVRAMNAMAHIFPTQNAQINLDKILDIKAFDLKSKIEINPQFAQEEFPFEAIIKYQLPQGDYTLTLEKGPDPTILLYICPDSDENIEVQKNRAVVAFAQSPKKIITPDSLIIKQLVQLNVENDLQVFNFHCASDSTLLFFTEHSPQEFNLKLTQSLKEVQAIEVLEIEHSHNHDDIVSSVGIETDKPLNMKKFNYWMSQLLREEGQNIFRCKGILNLETLDKRIVFQGVHMLFDMSSDREWLDNEVRKNQVVFIGKYLDRDQLTQGFMECCVL